MPSGRTSGGGWRSGAAALALIGAGLALLLRERPAAEEEVRWLPIEPPAAEIEGGPLDLRHLNEAAAGDGGFIGARDGRFVHLATGAPVRFWGVNGPPRELTGEPLRRLARSLAARGVNLVRIHEPHFDGAGEPDLARVQRTLEVVEALKAEGVYSYLSIYYPLWLTPAPGTPWLDGYDGRQFPHAALFFNPAFQERYRAWWRALLLTPSPRTGRRLVDEPAVAGAELQNEDSLLFPTLQALPEPQLRLLEARFAAWLARRHGSAEEALRGWGTAPRARDAPAAGRVALRPLWQMARERTARDRETALFLAETEAAFYEEGRRFLRGLGFRGLVGTGNWRTADERVLGPLLRWATGGGDFTDRHGYFAAVRKGEATTWSLRAGDTYRDRSALRFDGEEEGTLDFENPVLDARFGGKPSMLSEVGWERPSRYRAEAPIFVAAYGALQATDAIAWFRVESERWAPRFPDGISTPWPIGSPGQLGQFPAAARIFRQGLVAPGAVVARVALGPEALSGLAGTPLPLGAPLSAEERALAVSEGSPAPGRRLDPLLHLAGRVEVAWSGGPTGARAGGEGLVDPGGWLVRSSTGELTLDARAGLLLIDAPRAQGAVGALGARPWIATSQLRIASPLPTGAVVAVSLDGEPLATSGRMLLQVMSEEQATGFRSEPAGGGRRRVLDAGAGPWQVRAIEGTVALARPDAVRLRVTALDPAGRPLRPAGHGGAIALQPGVLHYLVER